MKFVVFTDVNDEGGNLLLVLFLLTIFKKYLQEFVGSPVLPWILGRELVQFFVEGDNWLFEIDLIRVEREEKAQKVFCEVFNRGFPQEKDLLMFPEPHEYF